MNATSAPYCFCALPGYISFSSSDIMHHLFANETSVFQQLLWTLDIHVFSCYLNDLFECFCKSCTLADWCHMAHISLLAKNFYHGKTTYLTRINYCKRQSVLCMLRATLVQSPIVITLNILTAVGTWVWM